MPVLKLLGGLRRCGAGARSLPGASVREVLKRAPVPHGLLLPNGSLNRDVEILVNGRNISFLAGLDTSLEPDDRVTVFFHGARGFPGG
jgi:molybdopterin converting factor small subunit